MPSPTPNAPDVALARLAVITGANDQTGESIPVHFNPASLQLQLSNELKDTKNNERKQYIAKSSAKLTMDLPFDTTDSGDDVTITTRKLQAFLAPPMPPGDEARQQIPPPLVLFEWGTLRFKGVAENYRETIDFFSASGVPLRASVNLTLSRQDQVFDESPGGSGSSASPGNGLSMMLGASAAGAAISLQAPGAARALAAFNGEENLRFGSGASIGVSASVTLKAAAAFSVGGGAGLSLGGGASAGFGVGAGAGVGASLGVSAGAGLSATARLSASEGAFAGLRVSVSAPTAAKLDPRKLLPSPSTSGRATDAGARFQVGGKATFAGAGGLRADVGATGKISFDGG